jgi:hypothetical protein
MKKKIIITALISLMLADCTSRQEIGREIKPKEKYNIRTNEDGQASYKDYSSELTLEIINDKQWSKLLGYECFKNIKSESSVWRSPKIMFHHVTIKNNSNSPVRITNIKLQYGQIEKYPLPPDEIKKRCISPLYSMIDFSSLLKNRRLLCNDYNLEDIDFDKNSIEYKLDFINSGDLISKITAFEWIPVEYRTYKIIFQLESPGDVKIIDFEFSRLEYREKGPFSRPEKEDVEDELW